MPGPCWRTTTVRRLRRARADGPPLMTLSHWTALSDELDRWHGMGRVAGLWWRDDDAAAATPALDRLLSLAADHGVFPVLAVIPARADASLVPSLEKHLRVMVAQHGWAHASHAVPPAKKCELGDDRPAAVVLAELGQGRDRLAALFGARFRPVLVPPWNRIAGGVAAVLGGAGFTGLSTFAPRGPALPGLLQVNTHADPIGWRRGGGLDAETALAAAVAHLAAKREGRADAGEPTGLLTHHLVQDDETWAFVRRFLTVTVAHPAVRWRDGDGVFGDGP